MQKNLSLLIFFGILLLVNIGFSDSFGGGRVANVTACGTIINAAAVSGNLTTNWSLGNVSGPTIFNVTAGVPCVRIQANDVVLDLNGSAIQLGNTDSTPSLRRVGISVTGTFNNITIRDGFMNVSIVPAAIPADIGYTGIHVNGSANVTISNVTFTSFSNNVLTTSSVAINISNVSSTQSGFVLINNVNISNVSAGGINIVNSTNVNITNSWFNAAPGGTWFNNSYAISATDQASTYFVNVTTTMFNASTNITLFFYSNLTVYLQSGRPISTAPAGTGTAGEARTFTDKMINLTGASSTTSANLTFWFNSNDISSASDTSRLAIFRTTDSANWAGPLTATLNLVGTNSLTATNIASFSGFVLFADASSNNAQSAGVSNPYSGKSDVPSPALDYSCTDKKITVKTESELSGGTIKMQYYCGSTSCGSCKTAAMGAYESSISSGGTATFDYFGPGEYKFEVTSIGSSTNYRPTVWWNSNWYCYKPDESCKTCTPTKESCPDGSSIEANSCDAQGNLVPTGKECPKPPPPPTPEPEPEPEPQPTPTPAPSPTPTPAPTPQPPKVVLDLTTPDKAEVGKEFVIKATKDGRACTGCPIVVKGEDGKEVAKLTTDKNGEAKITLANKGSYELSLLTDQGIVAKKTTVNVELAVGTEGPEKKTGGFLDDPGVQTGLTVVVVVLVLVAVYLWFTGQGKGKYAYKK